MGLPQCVHYEWKRVYEGRVGGDEHRKVAAKMVAAVY